MFCCALYGGSKNGVCIRMSNAGRCVELTNQNIALCQGAGGMWDAQRGCVPGPAPLPGIEEEPVAPRPGPTPPPPPLPSLPPPAPPAAAAQAPKVGWWAARSTTEKGLIIGASMLLGVVALVMPAK